MSEHTQGPWFTGRMLDPRDAPCVIGDDDSVVAILPGDWNGCTYIKADAALVAAAPELLAVTRELLREYEGDAYCASDDLIERATAAIAKAEAA